MDSCWGLLLWQYPAKQLSQWRSDYLHWTGKSVRQQRWTFMAKCSHVCTGYTFTSCTDIMIHQAGKGWKLIGMRHMKNLGLAVWWSQGFCHSGSRSNGTWQERKQENGHTPWCLEIVWRGGLKENFTGWEREKQTKKQQQLVVTRWQKHFFLSHNSMLRY